MTPRDFCYWLQGLYELSDPSITTLSAHQVELIKRHLAMVQITTSGQPLPPPKRSMPDGFEALC